MDTPLIDIRPADWLIVRVILEKHVPAQEVWAFGSRARWEDKDYSDLDLAIITDHPLSLEIKSAIDLDFADSDLPFKVDVVDWATISETFREIIRKNKVVIQEPESFSKGWLYYPDFPNHWIRFPLYSLAKWINGLAFKAFQFSPVGKPVIKIAEIKNGISEQTKFTNQSFDHSLHVNNSDLLFSWSGQPETSIDAFWWRGPSGWLNQHIFRVLPIEKIDRTFFFYLLRYLKPNFIGIARNKQTTGLGHVTKRDLEKIEAAYPPLPEQRAIAHILGTLDDKIELNRRMNETLEAMAQALFKSWFVDFDPVRAKMEGRETGLPKDIEDLFPDSIEDSELGEIPMGWRVGAIEEIASIVGGSTPSTKEPTYWQNGRHYWATPKDLSTLSTPVLLRTERKISDAGLLQVGSGQLPAGTVLLSSRAPIGYLAISEIPVSINQGFIAMLPREEVSNLFIFYWAELAHEEIVSRANGSTFLEISKANFRPIPVIRPTRAIMDLFEKNVRPLYLQIVKNERERMTLSTLRDSFLPKLFSGEIRIADPSELLGQSL